MNREWNRRARGVTPGGVASPVRAFEAVQGEPVVARRAEGARLVDAGGREYIDLVSAYGAIVLGHGHPAVAEACAQAARGGLNTGTPCPEAVRLAERVVEARPAAERVRFVNSGTEAVMSALRLARGATGRSKILKFEGCYHGHWDPLLVRAGSGVGVFGETKSAGVPSSVTADTAVVGLDDEEALEAFFEEHGGQAAAAVIEPVVANAGLLPQREGFLRRLEELCGEHGALLVFDEVVTGFRYGPGGLAERVGVEPDLVTLGKAVGGGLPIGAFGGREDLMRHVSPEGEVFQAGTASANRMAMRAGLAVLDQLGSSGHKRLARAAGRLAREGSRAVARVGARVHSHGPLAWLTFHPADRLRRAGRLSEEHRERFGRFHRFALEEGVHLPPSPVECLFVTLAFDEGTVDEAVERLGRAAEKMEASP